MSEIKYYDSMKTDIKRGKSDIISMSFDWIKDYFKVSERSATLLFIPSVDKDEHYHVTLTDKEVMALHEWCSKFLKMKSGKLVVQPVYKE